MKCACTIALAALLLAGCQHISPEPIDLRAMQHAIAARELDVPPVREALERLSRPGEVPAAFDLADGISLPEGEAIALWYNPELRIARLEAEKVKAVAAAAGRWPDPQLGIEAGKKEVEEAAGLPGAARGISHAMINAASLSITIPLSGRIGAERRASTAEYAAAEARARELEWEVVGQVRAAWLEWSSQRERAALLEEHIALLRHFAEPAQRLAEVGELWPSSARLAAIALGRREAQHDAARAAEREAHAQLLELLGLLPDAPVTLQPATAFALSAVQESFAHPVLLRAQEEYALAEARLVAELRAQYPDITISPQFTDEEDETALVVGLGIPIPLWNANRAGIAAARAERDLARARLEAEVQRLEAGRARAAAAYEGAAARRERLATQVAPLVDRQLEESLALLRAGELDMLQLHEVLGQVLEVKLELLEAQLAEALAAVRLDRAAVAVPAVPAAGDVK
jgi:cobalt-zinc-cadmium efflux system outer membrane protein